MYPMKAKKDLRYRVRQIDYWLSWKVRPALVWLYRKLSIDHGNPLYSYSNFRYGLDEFLWSAITGGGLIFAFKVGNFYWKIWGGKDG